MPSRRGLILVVDDQAGVRRLIQEVFREVGYRVLTATNGQEALAAAAAYAPSAVILDMKMPIMDGLETLRVLKAAQPKLLVVMMTAVGDGDQINEALSSGAHSCVSKPFDVFALRKLVTDVLDKEGKA